MPGTMARLQYAQSKLPRLRYGNLEGPMYKEAVQLEGPAIGQVELLPKGYGLHLWYRTCESWYEAESRMIPWCPQYFSCTALCVVQRFVGPKQRPSHDCEREGRSHTVQKGATMRGQSANPVSRSCSCRERRLPTTLPRVCFGSTLRTCAVAPTLLEP